MEKLVKLADRWIDAAESNIKVRGFQPEAEAKGETDHRAKRYAEFLSAASAGRCSGSDFTVLSVILNKILGTRDYAVGRLSAAVISQIADIPLRTVQRSLGRLEGLGLIVWGTEQDPDYLGLSYAPFAAALVQSPSVNKWISRAKNGAPPMATPKMARESVSLSSPTTPPILSNTKISSPLPPKRQAETPRPVDKFAIELPAPKMTFVVFDGRGAPSETTTTTPQGGDSFIARVVEWVTRGWAQIRRGMPGSRRAAARAQELRAAGPPAISPREQPT